MLKSQNIHLRGIEPADLDFLLKVENDPDHWRVSGTLIPFTEESLRLYVFGIRDLPADKQLRLLICRNDNKSPAGFIDIFEYDPVHRRAGTGLVVIKSEQNKGYASEALHLICEYAFDFLGLHQLWARIFADNPASIRLFEKAGFRRSCAMKEWHLSGGNWIDELFFQLFNPKSRP